MINIPANKHIWLLRNLSNFSHRRWRSSSLFWRVSSAVRIVFFLTTVLYNTFVWNVNSMRDFLPRANIRCTEVVNISVCMLRRLVNPENDYRIRLQRMDFLRPVNRHWLKRPTDVKRPFSIWKKHKVSCQSSNTVVTKIEPDKSNRCQADICSYIFRW